MILPYRFSFIPGTTACVAKKDPFMLTATMASIGTAAVPGVGLITLALVLTQVGLPVEGIALIIGVDRLLDMTRTVVNVVGDATVSSVVARSEGQFEDEIFAAESAR